MPYTPEAYALTPVKYVGAYGSIPALLLYERDGLSYLRLQTKNWPHYDGWGLWSTIGIWSEHVVRADPGEPAIADLLQTLEREAAAMRQSLEAARHQTNGQGVREKAMHVSKSKQENGQAPTPKSNCVKLPPKPTTKTLARQAGGPNGHSLKPARTIGGLCLQDFLGR